MKAGTHLAESRTPHDILYPRTHTSEDKLANKVMDGTNARSSAKNIDVRHSWYCRIGQEAFLSCTPITISWLLP